MRCISGGQRFGQRAAVTFFRRHSTTLKDELTTVLIRSSCRLAIDRFSEFNPAAGGRLHSYQLWDTKKKKKEFWKSNFCLRGPWSRGPIQRCTLDLLCPGTPEKVGDLILGFSLSKYKRIYRTQVCLRVSLQHRCKDGDFPSSAADVQPVNQWLLCYMYQPQRFSNDSDLTMWNLFIYKVLL